MVPFSNSKKDTDDGGGNPNAGRIQVYVNGVRVTGYGGGSGEDAFHALRDIRPSSVEIIEVYRGVARIPGEYLADACAVILVWTR